MRPAAPSFQEFPEALWNGEDNQIETCRRVSGQSGSGRMRVGRELNYQSGSDRGSPNLERTLFSKRVMAQIWSPVRVRT